MAFDYFALNTNGLLATIPKGRWCIVLFLFMFLFCFVLSTCIDLSYVSHGFVINIIHGFFFYVLFLIYYDINLFVISPTKKMKKKKKKKRKYVLFGIERNRVGRSR